METLSVPEAREDVRRNNGRPPEGHRTLEMLKPPGRGDRVALRWWWCGLIGYLLLGAALLGALGRGTIGSFQTSALSLFGFGTPPNYFITVLVGGGIALTVAAMVLVLRDIRTMAAEEEDIDWVLETKSDGLPLVFLEPGDRRGRFEAGERTIPDENVTVKTLVDDRVRRVHSAMASAGSATVSPENLKTIAVDRTARYGSFARYASSLLLLLAVLGTFAGVKTALPALITALGNTSDTASLIGPLTAVASAFGGNALALVGAIAVGLMAQGVGFGRRNLLERLELVSAEYLYEDATTSSANPLQAAVTALRDTAHQIHAATGRMSGIESGLRGLSNEFKTSFEVLSTTLADIADRQEEGLYERTSASLDALQLRVGDLARSVEATALVHSQITTAVQARAEESRAAIGEMKQTNARVGQSLDAFLRVGELAERSFGDVSKASQLLVQGSQGTTAQMQELVTAVSALQPGLEQLQRTLAVASQHAAREDARESVAIQRLGETISAQIQQIVSTATAAARSGAATQGEAALGATRLDSPAGKARPDAAAATGMTHGASGGAPAPRTDAETLALLRRIAQSAEVAGASRPTATQMVAISLITGLLGGGIVAAILRFL
jgi:hypothetical protein